MRYLRNLCLPAVAAVIAMPTSVAAAAPVPGDSPREQQARAYVEALVTHNPDDVKFAPDAKRYEVGIQTGYSGAQLSNDLRNGLQYKVIQQIRDYSTTENGNTVVAKYLLDAGVGTTTLATVQITESFEVIDGSIHLIIADIKIPGLGM